MTKMKDVNAHICPTCGGKLVVNVERQMYECPFCGVTFDYDYFREESVLEIASQALANNEFDSATRAYDFMLEKEPDNFEALRGKALIAMDINKIADIHKLDLFPELDYESAYKEIDRGIGASKPQDRQYFTTMKDIVEAGHEYIDEKEQLATQRKEREGSQDHLYEYFRERDTICIYSPSSRFSPKKAVVLTILGYLICCLVIFLGFKLATRNPYSKAEDLSQYETEDADNIVDAMIDYENEQKALEREEQRKINYDAWEESHKDSNTTLIWILGIATVIYVLVAIVLLFYGKFVDGEVIKLQAKVDEQDERIKEREEMIAGIKDRIDHGYKRLCELHPVEE